MDHIPGSMHQSAARHKIKARFDETTPTPPAPKPTATSKINAKGGTVHFNLKPATTAAPPKISTTITIQAKTAATGKPILSSIPVNIEGSKSFIKPAAKNKPPRPTLSNKDAYFFIYITKDLPDEQVNKIHPLHPLKRTT